MAERANGIDLGRLVNDLLKRDIDLIDAAKQNARRRAGRWGGRTSATETCAKSNGSDLIDPYRSAAHW
ncbi:MAG: hypothetical protein ACT4NL_00070 [Pseudomarimonas sp.]